MTLASKAKLEDYLGGKKAPQPRHETYQDSQLLITEDTGVSWKFRSVLA